MQEPREPPWPRALLLPALSIAPVPPVGADLSVMDADTRRMRGDRPIVFTKLKAGDGLEVAVEFLITEGGLQEPAPV